MSTDMAADEVASVSGHHSSESTASLGSMASFQVDPEAEEVEAVEDETDPSASPRELARVDLQLAWNNTSARVLVFASHDRFASGVPCSVEDGIFSAHILAPTGQDLLYRFIVDGEWQTSSDVPIMQLNGDEFNVVAVKVPAPEGAEEEPSSPTPKFKRRVSSMHWDQQRAALVISGDNASNTVAEEEITTPKKASTSPTPGVRFAMPATSDDGEDDGEDVSGDDDGAEDDPSATIGSASRTKRKNRAHRIKLKQRALFQTPPQMGNSNLSNSAPSFQTPLSSRSPHTPGQTLQSMNMNALKMEAQQRENEWRQSWIAHEIQTFQQREEERKVLKAQMNDERARWLAKLKEYTQELKVARDENLALKTDLAAAGTQKRAQKMAQARTEKFQTLQKNILNEEMIQWIRDKSNMQQEIETLKAAQEAHQTTKDELSAAIQTQSAEVTTLQLAVQSKERDFKALEDEIASLREQLSQAAGSGSEASEALSKAQNKLAEEVRAANAVRGELQAAVAGLASAQGELANKVKEIEQLRAAVTAANAASVTKDGEIKALHQKALVTQEELFTRTAELEQAQTDKEEAEQEKNLQIAQHAVREAGFQQEMAKLRSASNETKDTILLLSSTVKALRSQLAELSEVTLNHTSSLTKQMSDSQSFLTQALQVQANLLHSTMQKYKKEMSERRKLHNQVQELRGNIRVYARARPLAADELTLGTAVTIPPADEAGEVSTELQLESAKGKSTSFQFDAVFGPESTQAQVFSNIVSLVTSVLDGYNVCLFAYGQTGAGKTHTMQGSKEQPGMNLRSLDELFRLRAERAEDFDYKISVQFYEVYNENIYDLLDANREKELKIRQSSTGVYVEGLVDRPVEKQEDVLRLMEEGNKNRSTSATEMNAHSSRSHSILSVQVHGHSHVTGNTYIGKLHLIDLAGSERISRSQATGDRLKEAQAINLSLSALGNCIEALQKKQSHIPYRNSKLTYILQNSLGGNAKTLMMVNVSPSSTDVEETNCSLQFASRVRSVELGVAGKNIASSPPASSPEAAAAGPASALSPTAGTPAKRPATATLALKKPVATAGSAVKKPAAAGAPTSAVKKPLAK